jgi:hypothetical protein
MRKLLNITIFHVLNMSGKRGVLIPETDLNCYGGKGFSHANDNRFLLFHRFN